MMAETGGMLAEWGLVAVAVVALLALLLKHLWAVYGHVPLARLGWKRTAAPRAYVRALFDGYAADYDSHVLRDLDYQCANLVSGALASHLARRSRPLGHALDLGCGTGILGVLVSPRVENLSGVDLSQEMLRLAAKRRVYDALYQADILDFLRGRRDRYDAIFAADVLVYMGALDSLMKSVANALTPDGVFIFTTERLEEPGFRLMPTGRFAHHPDYVAETGGRNGLRVDACIESVLRLQCDRPVPGHLYRLRNASPVAGCSQTPGG